jgi:L-serine/L-threonine ammonia-lyase
MFESPAMSAAAGCQVWLKLEALQPPGSFKIRGIGRACQEYVRLGARRLISSSGGNAGIAVAYAGRLLSVPVLVVVPETTTERAKSLIRQQGAELIVHGASWHEANELALSQVGEEDAFLHPFDDPLVWQGHSSLVDEVAEAGLTPDAVVLSVGGGGLLCGVAQGMRRNGWDEVPLVTVETRGADSLAQSVAAGERIQLPALTSVATSLSASLVCQEAFEWTRRHPLRTVVVSDQEALAACERFLDDQRIAVEPACGASLAAVYAGVPELEDFDTLLVVVCGGVTASMDQIRKWGAALA